MSTVNNDLNLAILSWKRLHLARAKLKASARTSALLSGFAMVAMVELQVTDKVPTGLLITFTACTTLLVSVHMLALMISTCILPNLEAVASITTLEHGIIAANDSPHERLKFCIELAWSFSTLFGIFLFLLELAMLCWVKLWDIKAGRKAALIATVLLIPIGIIFIVFAIHFYKALVTHKYELTKKNCDELEFLANQLNFVNIQQQQQQQLEMDNLLSSSGNNHNNNNTDNISGILVEQI